jgi:fructose-bisphosphate aldolase, class I
MIGKIQEILGADASALLQHQCKTVAKENLHLPGPDFIDRILAVSDRPARTLVSLNQSALLRSGEYREARH